MQSTISSSLCLWHSSFFIPVSPFVTEYDQLWKIYSIMLNIGNS